jgi:hypothetical protein
VTFLPDANVGIVVLANAQNAQLFAAAVRTRILELLFDQPMEADAGYLARFQQEQEQFREKFRPVDVFDPANEPYRGRGIRTAS